MATNKQQQIDEAFRFIRDVYIATSENLWKDLNEMYSDDVIVEATNKFKIYVISSQHNSIINGLQNLFKDK